MGEINLQIIWLHSPNNLEILLVDAFVPPKFCMIQSHSSVIMFSFFIYLTPEVSIKQNPGDASSQHFHLGGEGALMLMFPNF